MTDLNLSCEEQESEGTKKASEVDLESHPRLTEPISFFFFNFFFLSSGFPKFSGIFVGTMRGQRCGICC